VVDVQAFLRLYDELVVDLKSLGETESLVRTGRDCHFSKQHLKMNQRYLVLAIDWDKGDTDELAYYRYSFAEPENAGTQRIQIYIVQATKPTANGSKKLIS